MGHSSNNGDMADIDLIKCLSVEDPTQPDHVTQERLTSGEIDPKDMDSLDTRLVVLSGDTVTLIEKGVAVEMWRDGKLIYKESSEREDALLANDVYVAHRIADCLATDPVLNSTLGDCFTLASTVSQLIHGIDEYFILNELDKEKYMKIVYVELCDRLYRAFVEHNDIPY